MHVTSESVYSIGGGLPLGVFTRQDPGMTVVIGTPIGSKLLQQMSEFHQTHLKPV